MSKTPIVAPSVLAADFANLEREIRMINESAADWIHVDIMDGVFVPNISMGLPVVEAIRRHAAKPLDVHLMIVQPERYVEAFRKAGAENISVHVEACPHLHRNLQQIRDLGCKAGVAGVRARSSARSRKRNDCLPGGAASGKRMASNVKSSRRLARSAWGCCRNSSGSGSRWRAGRCCSAFPR